MRKLTRCLSCSKIVALYKTYKAEVTEPVYIEGVPKGLARMDTYRGRMCHPCSELAGYKKRKKKDKKVSDFVAHMVSDPE